MAEMRDAGCEALADEAAWSKGHETFLDAGQRYAFDLTAWTAAYSKAVESGVVDPIAKADAVVAGLAPKANVDTSLSSLLTSFAGHFAKAGSGEISTHPPRAQILYWPAFITRMHAEKRLTQAHWDYVQAEWDLYAELTPQLQAAHTAVYGAPFNAAPAQAVATPFGVYRGGFVAAVIDPRLADDTLIRQMAEDKLGGTTGAFLVPSQMSGLDTVHAAVLALDLGLAQHGLDTALRFATLAEQMRDLMRLLRSDALHGKLPEETLHAWIDSAAHTLPAEDASGRMTGGAMNSVRRNPILSALFSQMKDSLGPWSHTANLGKDRLTDAALRLMRASSSPPTHHRLIELL